MTTGLLAEFIRPLQGVAPSADCAGRCLPEDSPIAPPAIHTFTRAGNAMIAGPPLPESGQAPLIHARRHDESAPIRQGYSNLPVRKRTGITRMFLRRERSLRHGHRRE